MIRLNINPIMLSGYFQDKKSFRLSYPVLFLLCSVVVSAGTLADAPIDLGGFQDGIRHARSESPIKDYPRLKETQFLEIAENILLYQNPDGGWPKNVDPLRILDDAEIRGLEDGSIPKRKSSLDNDNVYPQIEYLAEVFLRTGREKYREASRRGVAWILDEQRSSGGWRGSDVEAITFNDNVMAGTLRLLKKIVENKKPFEWVPQDQKNRAATALEKGIRCILDCQIEQDGTLTAWGQQHDHETFESIGARTYELPCVTAGETVGVIEFLMEIDHPSEEIVRSIESAVRWLDRVRIRGVRIRRLRLAEPVRIGTRTYRSEPVVVEDPTAPSIWARYYDLKTNEPFFANRDGIRVKTFAEVALERRTGYAWYGEWPSRLFEYRYPEWKKRIAEQVSTRSENPSRYGPERKIEIAENILLYQNPDGGWPKNVDMRRILDDEKIQSLENGSANRGKSTLDNRATYTQIEFLAEVFLETDRKRYRDAARRGIDWIIREQHSGGGWRGADVDAITFNDDVTAGTLKLLKKIAEGRAPFDWVSPDRKRRALQAMERGIRCLLKCQVKRRGRPTGWGQQHDHETFEPAQARAYELPGLTACESVGVVRFLMEIEHPTEEIVRAVEGAVAWLDRVRLEGIRIERVPLNEPVLERGRTYRREPVAVRDPEAPSIWARCYDLRTDKPFFANRNKKRVETFAEISVERRSGYAWYGYWPAPLLEQEYPEWKKRIGRETVSLAEYSKTRPLRVYRVEKKQEKADIPLADPDQVNNFHVGDHVLPLSGLRLDDLSGIDRLTVLCDGRPVSIGEVPNLHLFLNDNKIASLPPEFGRLDKVVFVYLNHNRLRCFPGSLVEMKNLLGIYLTGNAIAGIPEEIFAKTQLKKLEVADNLLDTVPEELGNLTNLMHLNLKGNRLATLPTSVGNLQKIRVCDFSDNCLEELPQTLGNLSPTYVLRLGGNPHLRRLPSGPGLETMTGVIEIEGTAVDRNTLSEALRRKTEERDSKRRRAALDERLQSERHAEKAAKERERNGKKRRPRLPE